MVNVRNKTDNKTLFRVKQVIPRLQKIDFVGQSYIFPAEVSVLCDGIGCSKSALINVNDLVINRSENPGMTEIRAINCYKYRVSRGLMILIYEFLLTSQNSDGSGNSVGTWEHPIGTFKSMDLLRDFCKRNKLNLVESK